MNSGGMNNSDQKRSISMHQTIKSSEEEEKQLNQEFMKDIKHTEYRDQVTNFINDNIPKLVFNEEEIP